MPRPIVFTSLPHVIWLLGNVGQQGLVYYCTDDYSHWPSANGHALRAAEQILAKQAHLVLAVSHELLNRLKHVGECRYFPHAVDFDHFASTSSQIAHPRLNDIPAPRIGFFGLLYEKIDFALLSAVAKAFPLASLVMIGPVAFCPEAFRKIPNVHLVGPQPYADLPKWIAGLDVLLLPYVRDEMIYRSNPLKLRECLATGKPTVTVDLPEARTYAPHVRIASTTEDFVNHVRLALLETSDQEKVALRRNTVRNERWEARADELLHYLRRLTSIETEPSAKKCPHLHQGT
ncbi:MAG: glycosyltransferase [Planctomycetes bacterium]|nr:glycosyltransferase [Planctomycetota bacterium]